MAYNCETALLASKLKDELLVHPIILSAGSLALSIFISQAVYSTFDWRPVAICVSADILTIGLDHYKDQAPSLVDALNNASTRVLQVFYHARILLLLSTTLLCVALSHSPPETWMITGIFIAPALLWNTPLSIRIPGHSSQNEFPTEKDQQKPEGAFVIKRIPGMKALFIGIIRGCGTFAVVHSILASSTMAPNVQDNMFTSTQILMWSTANRTCHAVMADIRDFQEDWENQIPTIPVLLKSVYKTRVLLTLIHIATMISFLQNPYIFLASVYAIALVWLLGEKTPKKFFRFSFHSQTIVACLYGIVESFKYLAHTHKFL
ncbi:hypothetical protein F5879DRAFT_979344 [Lentinula edodes]|nr:hypothetical protein F5879DRAFT_979344 [Lentinula edodes]KAJ3912923.1 hypothetical protein F5877DRAFT_53278 [Lentinula edodes]